MKNMIQHEIKSNWKPFLYWTLGLTVLVLAGFAKFLGFDASSGVDVSALMAQFPKVFLAMFGMAGLDIQSLGGYYAVLQNFVLLCTSIFAIQLGANAVSRESIDKTYEFIFTKPRTRNSILMAKLIAAILYLTAFSLLNFLFSHLALPLYKLENTITTPIFLFSFANYTVGLFFLSLSTLLSTLFARAENGMKAGNFAFLLFYMLSIVSDMIENPSRIQVISPMRYFTATELLNNRFSLIFFLIAIATSILALQIAFSAFRKRDLSAV
jgi:ABC-2 type transport system permease protein